jgi:hypothetical protein
MVDNVEVNSSVQAASNDKRSKLPQCVVKIAEPRYAKQPGERPREADKHESPSKLTPRLIVLLDPGPIVFINHHPHFARGRCLTGNTPPEAGL